MTHVEGALVEELLVGDVGACIGGTAVDVHGLLVVDARLGERSARVRVDGVWPALRRALISDRLRRAPRENAPAGVFFAG